MSLDEVAMDIAHKEKMKTGRSGLREAIKALDDYVPDSKKRSWTFRFRGRSPGRNGGAVVIVELDEIHNEFLAGVTICAACEEWKPERGIEKATARLNNRGPDSRPNKWRFLKIVIYGEYARSLQRQAYDFARRALHHAVILHELSKETEAWFRRQLPWVITGRGIQTNGKVWVG